MFEACRRAHVSPTLGAQRLGWRGRVPDSSEGVTLSLDDKAPQGDWFRVASHVGWQTPSTVLVERVVQSQRTLPQTRGGVLEGTPGIPDQAGSGGVLRRLKLSTEGFWEFLFSDHWEDTCLLRVLQGELLDNLLAALYVLQRDQDVISYVTIAYFENNSPVTPCIRPATVPLSNSDQVKTQVMEEVLVELDYFCGQPRGSQYLKGPSTDNLSSPPLEPLDPAPEAHKAAEEVTSDKNAADDSCQKTEAEDDDSQTGVKEISAAEGLPAQSKTDNSDQQSTTAEKKTGKTDGKKSSAKKKSFAVNKKIPTEKKNTSDAVRRKSTSKKKTPAKDRKMAKKREISPEDSNVTISSADTRVSVAEMSEAEDGKNATSTVGKSTSDVEIYEMEDRRNSTSTDDRNMSDVDISEMEESETSTSIVYRNIPDVETSEIKDGKNSTSTVGRNISKMDKSRTSRVTLGITKRLRISSFPNAVTAVPDAASNTMDVSGDASKTKDVADNICDKEPEQFPALGSVASRVQSIPLPSASVAEKQPSPATKCNIRGIKLPLVHSNCISHFHEAQREPFMVRRHRELTAFLPVILPEIPVNELIDTTEQGPTKGNIKSSAKPAPEKQEKLNVEELGPRTASATELVTDEPFLPLISNSSPSRLSVRRTMSHGASTNGSRNKGKKKPPNYHADTSADDECDDEIEHKLNLDPERIRQFDNDVNHMYSELRTVPDSEKQPKAITIEARLQKARRLRLMARSRISDAGSPSLPAVVTYQERASSLAKYRSRTLSQVSFTHRSSYQERANSLATPRDGSRSLYQASSINRSRAVSQAITKHQPRASSTVTATIDQIRASVLITPVAHDHVHEDLGCHDDSECHDDLYPDCAKVKQWKKCPSFLDFLDYVRGDEHDSQSSSDHAFFPGRISGSKSSRRPKNEVAQLAETNDNKDTGRSKIDGGSDGSDGQRSREGSIARVRQGSVREERRDTTREGIVGGNREGNVATSREGGVATSRDGSMATNRHGGVATSRDGSVATNREGGVATSREGGVATSRDGSVATSREGGVATSSEGGVATSREGGVATSTEGSVATRAEGGVKSREGSVATSTKGCEATSTEGSEATSTEGSVATGREGSVEIIIARDRPVDEPASIAMIIGMTGEVSRNKEAEETGEVKAESRQSITKSEFILGDQDPWHISARLPHLTTGLLDSIGERNLFLHLREQMYKTLENNKVILKESEQRLWSIKRCVPPAETSVPTVKTRTGSSKSFEHESRAISEYLPRVSVNGSTVYRSSATSRGRKSSQKVCDVMTVAFSPIDSNPKLRADADVSGANVKKGETLKLKSTADTDRRPTGNPSRLRERTESHPENVSKPGLWCSTESVTPQHTADTENLGGLKDEDLPDDIPEKVLFELMGFQEVFDIYKLKNSYSFERMFAHRQSAKNYSNLLAVFQKPYPPGKKKKQIYGEKLGGGKGTGRERSKWDSSQVRKTKCNVKESSSTSIYGESEGQVTSMQEMVPAAEPSPMIIGQLREFRFLKKKHHLPLPALTEPPFRKVTRSAEQVRDQLIHAMEMFVVRKERATTTRQFQSKVSVTFTRRLKTDGGCPLLADARLVVAGVCHTLADTYVEPDATLVPC